MIKRGDLVTIKPEYRDEGDDSLTWIAVEDEDGGRIKIAATDTGMKFAPSYVVRTDMLNERNAS